MEIKTKYDIGDKVWTIHNNKVVNMTIYHFSIKVYKEKIRIEYMSDEDFKQHVSFKNTPELLPLFKYENELFPTKEELVKSL